MNGAELLVKTAAAAGIDICFANPGTTELPLVEAFDTIRGIRPVLGLFEGCCSGAADGYARMTGKPAMTLFHLGPGLGNAIANLHNAKRAGSPVLNIIGDHATWHRDADAPLTMDIEDLSKTVSAWTRTSTSSETLPGDIARAMAVVNKGSIATLIVPQDVQWAETSQENISKINHEPVQVDTDLVQHVARHLRSSKRAVIILGGNALRANGLRAVARIKGKTGCSLLSETFPAHMERGMSLPAIDRIPYAPSFASEILSRYDCIVLAGAKEPVAFFGYRDGPSRLLSAEQKVIRLSSDKTNLQKSLEHLADFIESPPFHKARPTPPGNSPRPPLPAGTLSPKKASAVIAALQPENAIVVDESITSGAGYYSMTAAVPLFSLLTLTGGAIGQGMPCAVGAAIACPERPVVNFQADGSALYTVQSLWMQARESLNITTLVCANQRYKILESELARTGNRTPGANTKSVMDLGNPAIDWVSLGKSMGVPAVSVQTAEELARRLGFALKEAGPHLIEMKLA
jgi:acetolactate synthase-1/2/3 large subunit